MAIATRLSPGAFGERAAAMLLRSPFTVSDNSISAAAPSVPIGGTKKSRPVVKPFASIRAGFPSGPISMLRLTNP